MQLDPVADIIQMIDSVAGFAAVTANEPTQKHKHLTRTINKILSDPLISSVLDSESRKKLAKILWPEIETELKEQLASAQASTDSNNHRKTNRRSPDKREDFHILELANNKSSDGFYEVELIAHLKVNDVDFKPLSVRTKLSRFVTDKGYLEKDENKPKWYKITDDGREHMQALRRTIASKK